MSPKYDLNKFIKICKTGEETVVIGKKTLKDAKTDFNLYSRTDILDFIANDGLEKLRHINTKPLELNSSVIESGVQDTNFDKEELYFVDAYSFYSGNDFGYFAYYFNSESNRWVIKSFKINREPDPKKLGD